MRMLVDVVAGGYAFAIVSESPESLVTGVAESSEELLYTQIAFGRPYLELRGSPRFPVPGSVAKRAARVGWVVKEVPGNHFAGAGKMVAQRWSWRRKQR